MTDNFKQRVRASFESLVLEADANDDAMEELRHELEWREKHSYTLNTKLSVLGELLGIEDLDLAAQAILNQHKAEAEVTRLHGAVIT